MRALLAYCSLALALLSLLMWRAQPSPVQDGRRQLIWVSDDNPTRQGQLGLFNQTNKRYRVLLDPSNQGVEKVIVQSLAGVGPDLIDSYDAFQLAAYVKAGIVLDLTDELKRRGIDVQRDCFKGILGAAIYQGRVYGVPADCAADGIWYHGDIFEKAGIVPPRGPQTWEDLARLAQRLTVRERDGHVLIYGLLFDWNWKHFFCTYGAHVFSPDGTRCVVDQPAAVAAVGMMHDLMYKYKVSPTPVEQASMSTQGGWGSGSISWFGSKRAAMALGGRWWLASLRSYPGLKLGVFESPYERARAYHGYGRATLINKDSPNRQGALEFLTFLASAAHNRLVNEQADAVCAFKKYASGPDFLHDPTHPDEVGNDVWRVITDHAVPDESSPFVDGATVSRLMQNQIDLVEADEKSPLRAMQDAARDVNEAIAKSLDDDPSLAGQFRVVERASRP